MISGNLKERWEKSIETSVGLPIDLIRELDTTHLSFYLQNRDKIRIKKDDGKILYFFEGKKFTEKEFDDYLNKIDFRGAKISTEPIMRYITSEKINKDFDKIFMD